MVLDNNLLVLTVLEINGRTYSDAGNKRGSEKS